MPTLEEQKKIIAEAKKKSGILSILGFAMRAGKLVLGTDRICDEVRRHGLPDDGENTAHRPLGVVLLASDASKNTKKRIRNACTYYRVECAELTLSSEELAARLGAAATAACATFDRDFVNGVHRALSKDGQANGRTAE